MIVKPKSCGQSLHLNKLHAGTTFRIVGPDYDIRMVIAAVAQRVADEGIKP